MKFFNQLCPLCQQVMRLKSSSGVMVYSCNAESKSHYEIESDAQLTIEHIYAFPYAVDNYESSMVSRLYKWHDNKWNFLREVNRIVAQPMDKLLQSIERTCYENNL